jgi:hypothetical protein
MATSTKNTATMNITVTGAIFELFWVEKLCTKLKQLNAVCKFLLHEVD